MRSAFVGGLRLPGDETGDAHLFTRSLASLCESLGVLFQYGTSIKGLHRDADRIESVEVQGGERLRADVYVMALGSYSAALLRPLSIGLPIYPVKGYSLTTPIVDVEAAPVSTVMDETYKVAITRLGDRIRVGGTAELAGFSSALRMPRRKTLEYSVANLFPDGGDLKSATFWTGLRPMTPDGTPIVGRTRLANLFTNTGHGTLGWTMACGSGRLLADLVSGRTPDIESDDLAVERYTAAA